MGSPLLGSHRDAGLLGWAYSATRLSSTICPARIWRLSLLHGPCKYAHTPNPAPRKVFTAADFSTCPPPGPPARSRPPRLHFPTLTPLFHLAARMTSFAFDLIGYLYLPCLGRKRLPLSSPCLSTWRPSALIRPPLRQGRSVTG